MSTNSATPESVIVTDEDFLNFEVKLGEDGDEPNEEAKLSWRLDPEVSLSDWKIIVTCDEDDSMEEIYHVHKNLLAVGPNKSDYFASLFRKGNQLKEATTLKSEICLPKLAVDAFPCMLDFFYDGTSGDKHSMSVDTLVSLRYLSQYFSVRALFTDISTFVLQDVEDIERTLQYLTAAASFHDDKLAAKAAATCAKNLAVIAEVENNLVNLDTTLAVQVFGSNQLCCDSLELSQIVAKYCEEHRTEVDEAFLIRSTDESMMPSVAFEAALFFINLSLEVDGGENETLEDFRARCRSACAEHWGSLAAVVGETKDSNTEAEADAVAPPCDDWKHNYALIPETEKLVLLETLLVHGHSKAEEEIKSKESLASENLKLTREMNTLVAREEEIKSKESLASENLKLTREMNTLIASKRDLNRKLLEQQTMFQNARRKHKEAEAEYDGLYKLAKQVQGEFYRYGLDKNWNTFKSRQKKVDRFYYGD